MARVLVMTDYFIPGYKAGGLIQSLARLLPGEAAVHGVRVLTRDRDLGSAEKYTADEIRSTTIPGAELEYLDTGSATGLRQLVAAALGGRYDVIYLNSLWSPVFTLLPLVLARWRPSVTLLIAPRGQLSGGALSVKSSRKQIVGAALRGFLRSRRVVWHAASREEAEDIRRWTGDPAVPLVIAADMGAPPDPAASEGARLDGRLRVVMLSRIVPMKDVERFFRILSQTRVAVDAELYGPVEDAAYWQRCLEVAKDLPHNVTFSYKGELEARKVAGVFRQSDLMLFPTLGESFGHVIAEALAVGCPVATTPTTFWTEHLATGGGRVFDSDEQARAYIAAVAEHTPEDRQRNRAKCLSGYAGWFAESVTRKSMFTEAIQVTGGTRDELAGVAVPTRQ